MSMCCFNCSRSSFITLDLFLIHEVDNMNHMRLVTDPRRERRVEGSGLHRRRNQLDTESWIRNNSRCRCCNKALGVHESLLDTDTFYIRFSSACFSAPACLAPSYASPEGFTVRSSFLRTAHESSAIININKVPGPRQPSDVGTRVYS